MPRLFLPLLAFSASLAACPASAATEAEGHRLVATFELSRPDRLQASPSLSFSPDGQYLACGWMIVHVPTARNLGSFGASGPPSARRRSVVFSPDSGSVVINSVPLTSWSLPGPDEAAKLRPPILESQLEKHAAKVLDRRRLPAEISGSEAFASLPGGKKLVTVKRNMAALRDAAKGGQDAEADVLIRGGTPFACLGGRAVVFWKQRDGDASIVLWDLKGIRGEALPGSSKRSGYSQAAAVSPDGMSLVEAVARVNSQPGELRVWDLEARKYHAIAMPIPPYSVAYMPSGKAVAAGLAGGGIVVIDIPSGRAIGSVAPSTRRAVEGFNVEGLAVSAKGNHIAAYSANGTLRVFSTSLRPVALERDSPYFPAGRGATWMYRNAKGRMVKAASAGVAILGNERCVRIDKSVPAGEAPLPTGILTSEYYTVGEGGVGLRAENWGAARAAWYDPPVIHLGFPAEDGTKWSVRSKSTGTSSAIVSASFRLRADTVKVPAGSLESLKAETARFARESPGGAEISSEAQEAWYAKGIGLVKTRGGAGGGGIDLVEYLAPPRPGDKPSVLPPYSVWAGESRQGTSAFRCTMYVLARKGDRVSGELWMNTPDGLGKFTFSGTVEGNNVRFDCTVKEGRGLRAGANAGTVEGGSYSGTWSSGAARGTLSLTQQ